MELNEYSKIALKYIQEIPLHYQGVFLDEYVIMPDHIHAIIIIDHPRTGLEMGSKNETIQPPVYDETRRQRFGLLSKIVKSFKEVVVKTIRKQYNDYGFAWQRSFYDHIIRNERAFHIIRGYIRRNPARWKIKKQTA